jgi:hypothetical protein
VSEEQLSLSSKIFSEISQGYSHFNLKRQDFFLKHFSLADHFSLNSNKSVFEKEALALGLEREYDQVKFAIQEGWWSRENEEKIKAFRKTISNLHKTKEKLAYKSQKESVAAQIKKFEAILMSLFRERSGFVLYTVESYAEKRAQEEFFKKVLFKDPGLTQPFFSFSEDPYEEQDTEFIEELSIEINKISINLSHDNIKKVAASGFFQNMIFLADTSYDFWGKPVCNCSKYQNDLLLYGKSYRNFVRGQAENGKPLNEDITSDPEKLISFIENYNPNNKKPLSKKNKSENMVSSYVGATKEDLQDLGVKVEKIKGQSLLEMAKNSGGIIEKDQYLKARG